MGLRLQNMVPWGQYLEHAISFLENCRDAPLSDKLLCSWARMQHHTDDADGLFFVNGTIPNMSKALQNSEKHLHSYGKQVAESSSCRSYLPRCLRSYFTLPRYEHIRRRLLTMSSCYIVLTRSY